MPQFQAGGANDAITAFLMQREMENRQRMLDELTQRRQAEADEDRRRQIELQEQRFNAEQARQQQQDALVADDRQRGLSKERDERNVRGMMAEAMTQGPLTQDSANTIGIMALSEGMPVPEQVRQYQADARAALARSAGLADYEAKGMIDASIEAQAPAGDDRYRTVGGSIFDTSNERFLTPPQQQGGGRGGDMSPYTQRGQSRLLTAIEGLEPQIGPDTVGTWRAKGARSVQGFTPGDSNPTVDFDAALSQITALIGFDELNQMRAASKTGGALGNVSDRELKYLQSVAGALDPNQTEAAFRAQLGKVKAEIERVVNYGMGDQGGRGAGGGPGPASGPPGGGDGWITLPNGVRIREKR